IGALQTLLEFVLTQPLQRTEVAITTDGELQDGLRVGIIFADRGVFGFSGQDPTDAADAPFDIDRGILGGLVGEDDDDRRQALDRGRLDVVDVVDAGHSVLDALGDQRVYRLWAGARIGGGDHHDGEVERWQQVDPQPGPGDQADD